MSRSARSRCFPCLLLLIAAGCATIACTAVTCTTAARAASPEQLATVQVIGEGNGATYRQSGVIVAAQPSDDGAANDAWVLTCSHLFRDAIQRTLVWPPNDDAGPYEAEVVAVYDPNQLDLAILRFRSQRSLTCVPLAESGPSWGDEVQQVGYPGGRPQQVKRAGRVLASHERLAILEFGVQPGDSGSPLFAGPAHDRRVVGIVWGDNGRAHATPVSAIRPALETQCETGRCPTRGWYPRSSGGIRIQEPARNRPPAIIPPNAGTGTGRVIAQRPESIQQTAPEQPDAALVARLEALERELAALKQAQSARPERGDRGPAGPPGPPGRSGDGPNLSQMQALADQYLKTRPLTVQIVDPRGAVLEETKVALGGTLRLKLVPRR